MIRLLIKTHSKTGAKYFCKTNRSNWQQYKGSGPYWLNHLKSYGEEHITEVYAEFKEECDELVETALRFSEENDIVNSDLWKNQIPENGLGGGGWMKGLTYEECFGKSKASLIKEKLSKQKTEEHKKALSESRIGMKLSKENRIAISEGLKKRYADEEYLKSFTETMTAVNKDPEKRKNAGQKLKEKWKDSEYLEKMKTRPHGSNSTSLKEKWADPEWRKYMLEQRKLKREQINENKEN